MLLTVVGLGILPLFQLSKDGYIWRRAQQRICFATWSTEPPMDYRYPNPAPSHPSCYECFIVIPTDILCACRTCYGTATRPTPAPHEDNRGPNVVNVNPHLLSYPRLCISESWLVITSRGCHLPGIQHALPVTSHLTP